MIERRIRCWPVLALAPWLFAGQLGASVFDVKTFGAKGDGKTADREAIRKAIDAAAAAGGGTVDFPAGTYVTGSIRLRSNLTLQFEPGSRLEAGAIRPLTMRPSRTSGTSFRISDTAISTTA